MIALLRSPRFIGSKNSHAVFREIFLQKFPITTLDIFGLVLAKKITHNFSISRCTPIHPPDLRGIGSIELPIPRVLTAFKHEHLVVQSSHPPHLPISRHLPLFLRAAHNEGRSAQNDPLLPHWVCITVHPTSSRSISLLQQGNGDQKFFYICNKCRSALRACCRQSHRNIRGWTPDAKFQVRTKDVEYF